MAAFSTVFHGNFRPEVVSDIISNVGVEHVGLDVTVKFGDSRLDGSRDLRLPNFVTGDEPTGSS